MKIDEILKLMQEYIPFYRKLGDYEYMASLHNQHPHDWPDPEEYIKKNLYRYALSFQWIEHYVDLEIRTLDLGQHHSFLTRFLMYTRPSMVVELAPCDFRHALAYPDVWFSVILNTDVLEFIKDQEGSQPKHWVNNTGVDKFLWECHRITRQRGYMLLTTPNAISLRNVQRSLNMEQPLYSHTHVREYTPQQVKHLLESHEFEVIRMETVDIYENGGMDNIRSWMESQGYSLNNRGDEIFALAKRPI